MLAFLCFLGGILQRICKHIQESYHKTISLGVSNYFVVYLDFWKECKSAGLQNPKHHVNLPGLKTSLGKAFT